jgi:hypothetical protein
MLSRYIVEGVDSGSVVSALCGKYTLIFHLYTRIVD